MLIGKHLLRKNSIDKKEKEGSLMALSSLHNKPAKPKHYNLTTQQKNIWDLQKYYEGTAISNICGTIIYQDNRSIDWLQQSIRHVIENQTALRLRFSDTDPVSQYLSEEEISIEIRYFSDESEMDSFAEKIAREPMRVIDSPMCAFTIFRLGTRTGIVAKMNHLIGDAWSFGLIADQINTYYEFLRLVGCGRDKVSSTGKGDQCKDYLCYVQDDMDYCSSEKFEKDHLFWKEKYRTKPENSVIKLKEVARTQDINAKRIHKKLPVELSGEIAGFCSRSKFTEAVVFECAVLLYLSRVNAENKTSTIGVPVLNRKKINEKQTAGMYISTMPLKVDLAGVRTVRELLERVLVTKREMFRHQRFPYEEILRIVRNDHGFTGNLFDVMVSVQNSQIHGECGYQTKWYPNGYCEVPYVITVDQRDSKETYSLTADYQTAVFPNEAEAEAILGRIQSIIEQIVAGAENGLLISEIEILSADEKALLLNTFNDTHVDYPKAKCVHELFEEQAQRTPDRIALTFEGQDFTYKQIDEMSNTLAWHLRTRGVNKNEVVPIISKRDWKIIVAMLAVLKAGGAYMPVSPDYPEDRIRTILEISESRIALIYGYDGKLSVEKIDLAEFDFGKEPGTIKNINSSDDLCYIIFTSGSTGKPKGVSITHSNVCNYAHNNNNNNVVHRIVREDYQTIVSVTNIVFDIFVTESLLPLLNGLTICFASDEETVSQKKLASLIERNKADVIQTTPTKMRSYLMDKRNLSYLRELKAIVMGGEAFPHDLYTELHNATDAQIFNIYGPAETTVWSSNAEVYSADKITIGRPIANTQIYILDSYQKLLPIGVAGELCIAGAGVGRGYLNRPDLTAERFISNPFATEDNGHGKVLYRTGDLARWREDGEIEYLGRIDTQVKIRGLRIELGEIESVMAETEGIGLVAVAAQKDETGRQYLVGYYTSTTEIDKKAMRKRLSEKLPKYMVPNYFIRLDRMPMTASGKTDRKNLPVPDVNLSEREYVPPVTETEKILCGIMADVLSVSRYGVTDDFFELGGDSLGAISAVAMAHEKGIELGLQTLFDYPNVRELCVRLEETMKAGQTAITEVHSLSPKDYEKYSGLLQKNTIDDSALFEKKKIGNVFLTGATGFLGAHVLDALMKQTDSKVYCLVRAGEGETPEKRLADSLQWYFGTVYSGEIGVRIIPVEGDIERDDLSDMLPKDVQIVIHTAATVKHYGAYDFFRRINVEGTRHAADYACRIGAEFIHISTISVSGNAMADGNAVYRSEKEMFFGETDYYIGQPLDNVYIRSKFEAEQVVMDEILEHSLNAKIIRIGNLTNRASDFRFQPNYDSNAFLKRLKAILELGLFPEYLVPLYSEFSPVDLTAEGIVKIIQYAKEQTVFHLYSNKPLTHERMLPILRLNGIPLRIVTGEEFYNEVEGSLQSKEREFIFKSLRNDMDMDGRLIYDSNIRIKNEFTVWFMSKIGFEWNEIDEGYVKGYLDYFRKAGFLNV